MLHSDWMQTFHYLLNCGAAVSENGDLSNLNIERFPTLFLRALFFFLAYGGCA